MFSGYGEIRSIKERLTSIVDSVAQVGWGIAAVVAVRAAMITINGLAWRQSLAKLVEAPYAVFPVARWIAACTSVAASVMLLLRTNCNVSDVFP